MNKYEDVEVFSFDVWNTLIKPNPQFSLKRHELIAGELGISPVEAKAAYTAVKKSVDSYAEDLGAAFSTPHVYKMLYGRLQIPSNDQQISQLAGKVSRLFIENPPIIEQSVKAALALVIDSGREIGIASNSNFISGNVMNPFLRESFGIDFKFSVYSDLFGFAKPHTQFFGQVIKLAGTSPRRIIHIGDNLKTDGGARYDGLQAYVIDGPDNLFDIVEEICNGK